MTNVVVIGQGYVGLPLAQGAVHAGLSVTGFDLNEKTVDSLNSGLSHIDDLQDSDIAGMIASGYRASNDPTAIKDADVVVICVPTPLGEAGVPDLGAVVSATKTIATEYSPGTLIVLESTTYPGTTDDLIRPILESGGRLLDQDFFLAFSPERIDPGNQTYGLKNTPKVVGGISAKSTKLASEFYSKFVDTVVTTKGAKEAETAKLLENTYRHINIALMNEMARFCHELHIDLWNVIEAAKTKPFGFQAFYPGPGVGGHCIPIDPNYLSYQVRKSLGYPFKFVELAEEVNNSMPAYVVERVQDILNNAQKSLNGSTILLLGVTYKPNIADQRESPATPIAQLLRRKGAIVSYHDPKVGTWRVDDATLEGEQDLHTAIQSADLVVLLQNHAEYDADALSQKASLFFDTRGVTSSSAAIRL
ncbi:nucleotide sugar dehydrogenase [Pseudarthrobacter sp. NamE5]|uniref:nucleotide sugar dehydrogenase n=1 Tax=Pseudarthrobacter sp. NamE5 TaxID=2576839 RepID=UPI00110A5940|nr:nucleotide sugar dehydrogenase [Pseudarthrobacter sp. NamE5]TLM81682.1 nucleotide sugar dehydrogenase [Pseudarthrobacter sp. NamE5]